MTEIQGRGFSLWRGERIWWRDVFGALPSVATSPPPSIGLGRREAGLTPFQAHLPEVLNLKPKNLFLGGGEAGKWGLELWWPWVPVWRRRLACPRVGGSCSQRSRERGVVPWESPVALRYREVSLVPALAAGRCSFVLMTRSWVTGIVTFSHSLNFS